MKEKMDRVAAVSRGAMARAVTNTSLFVFAAFLFSGVLGMSPLTWYQDAVTQFFRFILVPWGMTLAFAQLMRRQDAPMTMDTAILFVLLVWMTVPFIYRFGLTFNNINAACGYAMVFFGVYVSLRDESPARRERLLDWACAVFGLFSLIYGGALLYCAATVQVFAADLGDFGFGICGGMYLCGGTHYNITGMTSVCSAMFCLCGAERARRLWQRLLYILGAVMMMIVIVLTQSRTARYVLLIALAAGVFCRIYAGGPARRLLRAGVAVLAAGAVLVAGYFGAARLSDAAFMHYVHVGEQRAAQAVHDRQEEGNLPAPEELLHGAAATDEPVQGGNEQAEPVQGGNEQAEPAQGGNEQAEPAQGGNEQPEPVQDDNGQLQAVQGEAGADQAAIQGPQPKARPAVDATLSGRTEIWANIFRMWQENPKNLLIGNGVGRTGSIVVQGTSQESLGAIALHNTYFQFIADYGLIGFGMLLVFFLLILGRCVRALLRGGAELSGILPMCMLVLAILATGLMESAPLGEMTPMNVVLFFALGVLVPRGERQHHSL